MNSQYIFNTKVWFCNLGHLQLELSTQVWSTEKEKSSSFTQPKIDP